jgi:hypothetical protein
MGLAWSVSPPFDDEEEELELLCATAADERAANKSAETTR